MRRSIGSHAFDGLNVVFMAAFCITVLYPFWNLILVSLEGIEEAKVLRFKLTNTHWSASAYQYLLFDSLVLRSYRNTILRTVVGTAMSLFVCSLAAYTLSKRDLPGRSLLMAILLITLFYGPPPAGATTGRAGAWSSTCVINDGMPAIQTTGGS